MTTRIGTFELTALLSVARLGEDAYGASIRRDLSARAGREYAIGAVYTTLQRLADKRLITSFMSEPTAVRGGRARRCYRLTAAAMRVIAAQHEARDAMWEGVPVAVRPA